MNVQIRNIDSSRKNLLETDKIVHVKVIERKAGSAVIELNGYRTEALIEAETPDNFLAFAEAGSTAGDTASIKLRVLSSFRNTREFSDYSRQKVIDSLQLFLLENNLPMDPEYFEYALLLRSAGIKLNPSLIRLLHYASRKGGEDLVQVITGFLKNGAVLDTEFIDLFPEIRTVLKLLLRESAGKPPETAEAQRGDPLSALTSVVDRMLGNGSYQAFLLGNEGEETLVQFRSRKNPDRERFYFELSGDSIGEVLLVIDRTPDSYRVTVYLNSRLYGESVAKIGQRKEELRAGLQKNIPDRKLILDFTEWKDGSPGRFWIDEGDDSTDASGGEMFNLDISV